MNYDKRFADLIADIKADKTIVQPWRNKAIGRFDEAQALLEKGQRMTYMQPPGAGEIDMRESGIVPGTNTLTCTCPEGGTRKDCPIHGSL